MVLYHAITTYQLLECVEHKILFHSDETGVLVIPTFFVDKMPTITILKELNIFDDIVGLPYHTIKNDKNTLKQETMKMFSTYFQYDIKNMSNIYVCGYQYFISIYLMEMQIPFNIFEEAPGGFSRKEKLEEVDKKIHEARYEIIKESGLYDLENDLILNKYCILEIQREGFESKNIINFDPIEKFSELEDEVQVKLKKFFGCTNTMETEENSVLILTNHLHNLGLLTYEEHIEAYQIFVDYFLENKKLIFKLHPDDVMPYEKYFSNSVTIKEKFPSELLPFVFENIPDVLATISSTGFFQLQKYFDSAVRIGFEYEQNFWVTHRYYVITQILRQLSISTIEYWNIYDALMNELLKINHIEINCEKLENIEEKRGKCVLIDRWDWEQYWKICDVLKNLKDDEIIIFIDTEGKCVPCNIEQKDLYNNIVPILIKIKKFEEVKEEKIYVYSKNDFIRRQINSMKIKKNLKYSDKQVQKETLSQEEIRIKVLEGMLNATEKRLNYYIEKEKKEI